jgi:signal transduction histidine kinase/CheY-like chemotaxis protein
MSEIERHGWSVIVIPEDIQRVAAELNEIRDGETREYDGRIVTREGEVRWMRTRITGRRSSEAGNLRVLGASRDITEAMRAQAEQRRLEAEMQEAQKLESLGVMAGGVAHDFNNALAVILGNDLLAMGDADPDSRLAKQLERIHSAAKHAEALTNQMLTYSGKASVSLKPLDLSRLIEETSELLEASIPQKFPLDISLEHGRTLVDGDPTQLRQVVVNLVINAAEAQGDIERPDRIAVRCGLMTADADYLSDCIGASGFHPGDYVFVEVSDSGEGIDDATRKRIFEPFFSTKFTGRGLGLASVLGIVRGHRGAIKLVTQPGEGTSFRVLLPPAGRADSDANLEGRAAGGEQQKAAPDGGEILVVDDDEAVLELAGEFLERAGLAVVAAGGGREALEILGAESGAKIAAVVLDLAMPDLDGRDTLLEIRRLRPGLPVVVVSGFGEEASTERIVSEEIAAFLRKPYEPDDLIEAVRTALRG